MSQQLQSTCPNTAGFNRYSFRNKANLFDPNHCRVIFRRLAEAYTLQYSDITKVFFIPHQGRRRQYGNQETKKSNNGIKVDKKSKATMASNIIVTTITSVRIVATVYATVIVVT
jgi:hypothetical protein